MIPVQSILSSVLAEIVRRQPASKERTTFAWQLAVGPALARATTVELRDGVLTVRAVDRRWISRSSARARPCCRRCSTCSGPEQVTRLKIVA